MARRILIAAAVLALVGTTAVAGTAEQYRGPMNEVPRGFVGPSTDGPIGLARFSSRSRQVEGLTRWEFWWELNRDRFLRTARSGRKAAGGGAIQASLFSDPAKHAPVVTAEDVKLRIVPVLLKSLRSGDPEERTIAALALGKAGVAAAFGPLKTMLEDGRASDRRAAALALGFLGEPLAAPALTAYLTRSGVAPDERSVAAISLGFLGTKDAAPTLRKALGDTFGHRGRGIEDFQAAASAALGLLRDEGSVAVLTSIATNSGVRSGEVRGAALIALGRIGDREALPAISGGLDANDADVRRAAAQALGILGSEKAVPSLIEALSGDGDVQVRNFAAIALARIGGPKAGDALVEATAVRNPRAVRGFSLIALGILGDESRMDDIRPFLDRKDESSLTGAASIAVALLDDTVSLPRLRAIALDGKQDDNTRGYATLALSMMGDPVSRGELAKLSRKMGATDLRRAATLAVGLRPELPAGPALLRSLVEEGDAAVRGAAIGALALTPRRSMLEPLLTLAGERGFSGDARKDALTALGALAMRGAAAPTEKLLDGLNYRSLCEPVEQLIWLL